MHLIVVGLNHHSAPIELRERLAFSESRIPEALRKLRASVSEAAILSTCNRAELYAAAGSLDPAGLVGFLSEYHSVPASDFASNLYTFEDADAAAHLLRVACGLDSLVLGEPQILGQVRDALAASQEAESAGPLLDQLFRTAIAAGKRARTETGIGKGGFSIGHAAVDLARSIFGSLEDASVLILGAGKMSELTAKHLTSNGGVRVVLVANRTHDRAQAVAGRLGGRAIRYDEFPDAIASADIVISSTASPSHIVHRDMVAPAMRRRRGKPLFMIDISVPRDIAPDVGELDNVFLYDIDDLEDVVEDMARERAGEAQKVEMIVGEETARFMAWWRSRDAAPLVTQIKQKHEKIRQDELRRLRNQLPELPDSAWERIEAATRSMINRAARDPIATLKSAATDETGESDGLLDAAREIFGINGAAPTVEDEVIP